MRANEYKKMGIFLGCAFAAYYLIAEPNETSALVRSALTEVGDAAAALADFVRRLVR